MTDSHGGRERIQLSEILPGDDLVRADVGDFERLAFSCRHSVLEKARDEAACHDRFSETDFVGQEHAGAIVLVKTLMESIDRGNLKVLEAFQRVAEIGG
jgi:hypothetical protein